ARGRKNIGDYQRRHWGQNCRRGIQRGLPQGSHEIHRRVERFDRENGLLGGSGEPLRHLSKRIYRDPVVLVEGLVQKRFAVQRLHYTAVFSSSRYRAELT